MRVIFSRVLPLIVAGALLLGPGAVRPTLAQEQARPSLLRWLCSTYQKDGPRPLLWLDLQPPTLSYDGGMLRLGLSRPLVVEEGPQGLLELFLGEPVAASSAMPIAEGARLIRAQSAGRLHGRLVFQPEPGPLMASPCLVLGGGHVTRVRIVPLTVILSEEKSELARLHTEAGAALAAAERSSRPDTPAEVQLNPKDLVFDGDDQDLPALGQSLLPLQKRALSCYRKALSTRPGLFGRFVMGAEVDRDGRLSEPRIELDAISDRTLARCLLDQLPALRLPHLRRSGHLSIPLSLRLIAGP